MNYRDLGGGLAVSTIWEEKLSRKEATSLPSLFETSTLNISEWRYVGLVGGSKLACPLAWVKSLG